MYELFWYSTELEYIFLSEDFIFKVNIGIIIRIKIIDRFFFIFSFSFEFIDKTKIYKIINPPTINIIIRYDSQMMFEFKIINSAPKIVVKIIEIINIEELLYNKVIEHTIKREYESIIIWQCFKLFVDCKSTFIVN